MGISTDQTGGRFPPSVRRFFVGAFCLFQLSQRHANVRIFRAEHAVFHFPYGVQSVHKRAPRSRVSEESKRPGVKEDKLAHG